MDVETEQVEYLRHGEKGFSATIYRPRGPGPFPAVVEAHGGAWVEGKRENNDAINRAVAAGGIVVAAIDFRNPPEATYPGSVADMNYAIRWLKANAARFGTAPELVGAMGTSSGGHLAVLNGLKPRDPRYAAIPLAGGAAFDARVPYVVALWPVICPLGRYRAHAGTAPAPEGARRGGSSAAQMQMRYWLTEAAMGEGSALLAAERGDAIELPRILYLQNPNDPLHPRDLLDGFVAAYRRRGGAVEPMLFEGEKYDLPRSDPASPGARKIIERIVSFIRAEAQPGAAGRAASSAR
jgi:acetyl esterase